MNKWALIFVVAGASRTAFSWRSGCYYCVSSKNDDNTGLTAAELTNCLNRASATCEIVISAVTELEFNEVCVTQTPPNVVTGFSLPVPAVCDFELQEISIAYQNIDPTCTVVLDKLGLGKHPKAGKEEDAQTSVKSMCKEDSSLKDVSSLLDPTLQDLTANVKDLHQLGITDYEGKSFFVRHTLADCTLSQQTAQQAGVNSVKLFSVAQTFGRVQSDGALAPSATALAAAAGVLLWL